MRSKATWLILIAVGAVVTAGVVDSVRGSSSTPPATRAGESATGPSTAAALPVRSTTDAVGTAQAVTIPEPVDATVTAVQPAEPERLPSCASKQLRLSFKVSEGLASVVLRRVKGQPCHQGRVPVVFTVRDQSGGSVAVFGGDTSATQPADFSNGFVQLIEMPQMSCDPEGSFLVVATVGSNVVRRTLPGAELPCNHG